MAVAYNPLVKPVDFVLVSAENQPQIKSPGICTIYDGNSKRKWEELATRGYTGSFTRFLNTEAAHPRLEIKLLTDQHWQDFTPFHAFMMQAPRKRSTSQADRGWFDIYHPLLAMMGIKAVGVEEVKQPTQDDYGVYVYNVQLIEWKGTPKLTLAKPDAAKAPGPESETQAYIRRLTTELDTLATTPKRP